MIVIYVCVRETLKSLFKTLAIADDLKIEDFFTVC